MRVFLASFQEAFAGVDQVAERRRVHRSRDDPAFGLDTAAALLVSAGDNPERLHSEASLSSTSHA
jgi:hypothetical protein